MTRNDVVTASLDLIEAQAKARAQAHPETVRRTDVAQIIQQTGLSQAKARMLVHLACAELELPAGDISPRVAGEVETIAMRKARAMMQEAGK